MGWVAMALLAEVAPSTNEMAQRLEDVFRRTDWRTDPNKPSQRVGQYRALLLQQPELRDEIRIRIQLGEALINDGQNETAVRELEGLRTLLRQQSVVLNTRFDYELRFLLATAYMRSGEQENCVKHHGVDSCLYPIRGQGVHTERRGAEGAWTEWRGILERSPQDMNARWLLNIMAMTLGRHPGGVPRPWLIRPDFLQSEFEIGRFPDVAAQAKVAVTGLAGGVVAEDFDHDGWIDLMISSSGPQDPLRYFRNRGDGTFEDRTEAAGLSGLTGGLNLIHADYNNDGHADVLVLRGGWWGKHGKYPNSLLKNNGDGTFRDVTVEAGLLSFHPTQTAAWADYDLDGFVDLYIGNESSVDEAHPSEFYRNNGDGTFTNLAAKLGLADMGYVKGVAWGDFNNDGRPDLYVSRKGAPNRLFRNEANGQFTDVTAQAGVAEPLHSFGTWFWDYDNDGWLDLLVVGYYTERLDDIGHFHLGAPNKAEVPRLYRNRGNGTFEDVTKKVRLDRVILAMGSNYGDLDNDGWLDCYFGTGTPEFQALLPNRMFRNDRGRAFQDVTMSGGFGHLQKGHGIAFADFDNDGDQDVFEVMGGALPGDRYQSVLYRNPGHGNAWVKLRVAGRRSNRAGIGARVRVDVDTAQGPRSMYRMVTPGSSFGDVPFTLHVGLGDARAIRRVEVSFPVTGKSQTWTGLALRQTHVLREEF